MDSNFCHNCEKNFGKFYQTTEAYIEFLFRCRLIQKAEIVAFCCAHCKQYYICKYSFKITKELCHLCNCKAKKGYQKNQYYYLNEAMSKALDGLKLRHVKLIVYKCKTFEGYHLSSVKPQQDNHFNLFYETQRKLLYNNELKEIAEKFPLKINDALICKINSNILFEIIVGFNNILIEDISKNYISNLIKNENQIIQNKENDENEDDEDDNFCLFK